MAVLRKIIEIDEELCNGCGDCIISCAEGALEIVDGKAKLVADKYCDGLGACLGECPTGALNIVEREAEDFDEEAVEELLASKEKQEHAAAPTEAPAGCPSARLQSFEQPVSPCAAANQPRNMSPQESQLRHWPVQIRLVPPEAPFLKNADLLIAADCTPLAYANFHKDFLKNKVVLLGCPKFDDAHLYLEKFTEIFKKADISSITAVFMEVPCCHGLPAIAKKAMEAAGKRIPLEQVVIGVRGDIVGREQLVA